MPNRTTLPTRASLPLFVGLALAAGAVAQTPKPIMPAEDLTVSVSGSPVEFTGGKPMMEGESVLVPFRAVLEKLGSTVAYDPTSKRIDASTSKYKVQLTPGSTAAKVNDRDITMAVAPKLVAGTVYIPLRFVSESLGATVQYDAAGKAVTIVPGKEDTPETQSMNEGSNMAGNTTENATGNSMGNGSNDAMNMTGNTSVDDANNASNMTNMASNTDANAANSTMNDANATNNAPVNATNAAPTPSTTPAATATTAVNDPLVAETESSNSYLWPILGVIALGILAAVVYFALKGRRSGQVIASNNDNTPK